MKLMKWIIAFIILIITTTIEGENQKSHSYYDQTLRKHLFEELHISPKVRPVQYHNKTLEVEIYFWAHHIIHLDEKSETLNVAAWQCMRWVDFNIKWNPNDYGNIKRLRVDPSLVWIPEVHLRNNAEESEISSQPALIPVWVDYLGHMRWCPFKDYKSVCPLHLQKFPFDEHECSFTFYSWYPWRKDLNLTFPFASKRNIAGYLVEEHNEWEITKTYANMTPYYFQCCPDMPPRYYPTFFIRIRRREPFYLLAHLLPAMIAILMTFLIFWIPPTSKEKFAFGGINCFILLLFVAHMFKVVPRSGSKVPAIIVLLGNALFFSGFSLLLSILTTILYKKPPQFPPPQFIRSFLSIGLVRLVLFLPSSTQTSSGNQNENLEASEQIPKSTEGEENEWKTVADALDKITFYTYFLIFAIIFTVAFN